MATRSLRVAIADDDRWTRRFLQQMLEKLGHEVVAVAEDGQSLIKQCCAVRPDVVITDNLMPDMHGVDAAAVIYQRRAIPIILLSGYCDRDLVLDAEQKHVLLYLVKPISQPHLEAALEQSASQVSRDTAEDDSGGESMEPVDASGATLYRNHNAPPYRRILRLPR